MTIADIRALVRRDLKDEDPAEQRWSDNELDRHIQHAVRDLGQAAPLEAIALAAATPGSREVSLGSLRGLVRVEAVEYPVNRYPASFVPFSVWAGSLTLQVDTPPAGGEPVRLYYGALHTLDAASSTLPTAMQDTVATGAAAYAALEWASYAANRVNLGGEDTSRRYQALGKERLGAFQLALGRVASRNNLRVRQFYGGDDHVPRHLKVQGV